VPGPIELVSREPNDAQQPLFNWINAQIKVTENHKDGVRLSDDEFYKNQVVPYLLGQSTDNPFATQPPSTLDDLIRAKTSLQSYLAHQGAEGLVCPRLKAWYDSIANRMENDTLDASQRAELIEEIYRNLFMAQVFHAPDDVAEETVRQEYVARCITRAQQLNENISHWKGWKVAASLALGLFGVLLLGMASLAIASGYGGVVSSFVTGVAAFNGFTIPAAVAYMTGYEIVKERQWKREIELTKKGVVKTGSEIEMTVDRRNDLGVKHVLLKYGIYGVALFGFGMLFCKALQMQSATLSLTKALATKIVFAPNSAGNLAGACITGSMLLVAAAGAHAMWQAGKMLKHEWDKSSADKKSRTYACEFFQTVQNQPVVSGPRQQNRSRRSL